jgi:hypothetical protein
MATTPTAPIPAATASRNTWANRPSMAVPRSLMNREIVV